MSLPDDEEGMEWWDTPDRKWLGYDVEIEDTEVNDLEMPSTEGLRVGRLDVEKPSWMNSFQFSSNPPGGEYGVSAKSPAQKCSVLRRLLPCQQQQVPGQPESRPLFERENKNDS